MKNNIVLWQGDCLVEMDKIKSHSIDLILTDLPYGTTTCKWDTVIPFDKMWKETIRVLKPNGSFITTCTQPFTSFLIVSNPKMYRHRWFFQKSKTADFLLGAYRPLNYIEDVIVFSNANYHPNAKNKATYNPQIIDGKQAINKGQVKSENLNAISYRPNPTYLKSKRREGLLPKSLIAFKNESGFHPTQKPTALFEYLIRTYSNEEDTILDISMGSGTTMVACKHTNRNGIGIEKERKYYDIAVGRVESE